MASSPTSAPKGIRFNHVAVRVSDLKRSLAFYTEGLGMKELGRFDLDTFTIVPLGFEDTVQEGLPALQREGVLELVHAKNSNVDVTTEAKQSLVRLCFTVPDIEATMKHLKASGAKVILELGDEDLSGALCRFLGADRPEKGLDKPLWEAAKRYALVEDPDSHLIEIARMEG